MHVVMIKETPQTKDQSSKKLTTKTEQEGMLRKTPKTRVVSMKVSDTATYSREKTVEVEVPHHADKETVQAAHP